MLIVGKEIYHVHTKRTSSGFSGYVIHEGEYYMTLPDMSRENDVIDEAYKRLMDDLE